MLAICYLTIKFLQNASINRIGMFPSNPLGPDLCIRVSFVKSLCRFKCVLANFEVTRIDVHRDDLTVIPGFDFRENGFLVKLLAQTRVFFRRVFWFSKGHFQSLR